MSRPFVRRPSAAAALGALSALGAVVLAAAPLAAQESGRNVSLTPYAGYISYGNLQQMPTGDQPERDGNLLAGLQGAVQLTRYVSVLGNVGYAKSPWSLASGGTSGVVASSGDLDYILSDVGVEVKLPINLSSGQTVVPFAQGGMGAVRYSLAADGLDRQSNTDFQANFGGGLDVPVGAVQLRVMVKDYLTSLQWTDFRAFADVDGARPDDVRVAHNVAFTAGLRFAF